MAFKKIKVEGDYLKLFRDDSSVQKISLIALRRNCPCAFCLKNREEEKHFKVYRQDEITIEKINIVGQYAISIEWKDGHNTGIYEFDLLEQLQEQGQ